MSIQIVKADGSLPDKTRNVWPVNNTLHSLFSIVRVYINDQSVVNQPDYYAFKAYIADILTYDDLVKNAQLQAQGFYKELSGHMTDEDFAVNTGFKLRNSLFRKNFELTEEYSAEGTTLFGRLQLDFNNLDSGLPPGTKVQIQLVKNSPKFVLMKEKADTENYKIKWLECNLYIPVAQVSAPIYTEINSLFSAKSVSLHFRKTEVRVLSVPANKIEFFSDNIFSDDIPCRIVICFIEDKAREGDYSKNPFEFRRHWKVTSKTVQEPQSREQLLEKELTRLKQQFEFFQRKIVELDESREPAKKDSTQTQSIFQRLFTSNEEEEDFEVVSQHSAATSEDPPGPNPLPPNEKLIHLRKVELLLNGIPLDQV